MGTFLSYPLQGAILRACSWVARECTGSPCETIAVLERRLQAAHVARAMVAAHATALPSIHDSRAQRIGIVALEQRVTRFDCSSALIEMLRQQRAGKELQD